MKKIFTLFVLLLNSFIFYSQNDECANAKTLLPATTCTTTTGSFSGATISTPAPACAPNASQDLWYKFTAIDATIAISVLNNANNGLDLGFEVFSGNCNGTSLFCLNDGPSTYGGEVSIKNSFVIGQTYYIRVFNVDPTPSTQNFTICLITYPAPANNICANAETITPSPAGSGCNNISGTLSGATMSTPAPICTPNLPIAQDVWYKFTATDPTMSILLWGYTNKNNGIEIFEGNCNGTSIACINTNYSSETGEYYNANNFTVGQTYYVRIFNADYTALSTVSFNICVQGYPTPANDLCANAITVAPSTTCTGTSGTLSGATMSTPAPICTPNLPIAQDVWYKFTATDPTMGIYIWGYTNKNNGIEIFEGNCNGTSIACVNTNYTNETGEYYNANNFTVGQTYYVRIFNADYTVLSIATFNICVESQSPPQNDQCANAITLTTATTCNPTAGTFSGATISTSTPVCAASASQDVWYKFIATDTTMNISLTASTNTDNGFEILEGNCTGTSAICQNGNGSNAGEFYNSNNFTVGQTYYIRVFNANANLSTASFTICVYGQIQPCTPTINISASQSTTLCAGTTATFTAAAANGGTAPVYQWKVNGNNKGTNSDTFTTDTIANNDTVTCVLTSNAPCAAAANTATSNPITITVNPLPAVTITYASQILTATPGYTTYQWSFSGSNIQGATTNTCTPTQTGQYTVVVTNTNGCTTTAIYNVTSLSTNAYNKPKLSIYPNPANSSINIQLTNNSTIDKVIITDLTGKKVIEQKSNSHQLNVQHLQQGIYIIQVLSGGQICREKFIKQ